MPCAQSVQLQQEDYGAQYELEIARLRDEIDALRQANAVAPEDPRVAPLQDELKARMEDLRRFEEMLQHSQERTKDAESGRSQAMTELDALQVSQCLAMLGKHAMNLQYHQTCRSTVALHSAEAMMKLHHVTCEDQSRSFDDAKSCSMARPRALEFVDAHVLSPGVC